MATSRTNQVYKYWSSEDLSRKLTECRSKGKWDEVLNILLEADPKIWGEGLIIFNFEELKSLILRTVSLIRWDNLALVMAKALMDKADEDHTLVKGLDDWALNMVENIYVVCLILFRINKIKGIA